jgi:CHAT domain-containing protein/tetratricopeptide (TPR) repeat protein
VAWTVARVAAGAILTAVGLAACGTDGSSPQARVEADALRLQYEKRATEQAVALYRTLVGGRATVGARDAALAGHGLGAALEQLGLLDESLAAYQEALRQAVRSADRALESRLHGAVGVAMALTGGRAESLDAAWQHCQTGLAVAQRIGAAREEAAAFNCLGEVSYSRGDLARAKEAYQQAEVRWSRLGDQRGQCQANLAQGWVHSDMRELPQARSYLAAARSLAASAGDRRQLAITLVAQARLEQRQGDYERALEGFSQALTLLEPMGDTIWLGATLTGTAQVMLNIAEVGKALEFWERALRLFESSGSRTAVVDVLMSAGETLLDSGDESGALNRFERALAIAEEIGNERLQAWALRGMGAAEIFRRRPEDADVHLRRALALSPSSNEKRLEASVLADLGEAHVLRGELSLARSYFIRARASSQAAGDRTAAATQLYSLGVLEGRLGDLVAARSSLTTALAEQEPLLGAGHPLPVATRVALAEVDLAAGAYRRAFEASVEAEGAGRDYVRGTLRYLPERQALTLAERRVRGLDVAISAALSRSGVPSDVILDLLFRSRGLVLDELAARRRLTGPQAAASDLAANVRRARQRFANLLVQSMEGAVPRSDLDLARGEKEVAERALAAESADDRPAAATAGLEAVRDALPGGAALVSYVQYAKRVASASGGRAPAPVPSIAAFVMRRDSSEPPIVVPLGDVARIERLIAQWRVELAGEAPHVTASREPADRTAGVRLKRVLWDPIAAELQGATRVFVVPDGAVGVVPFAALPVQGEGYLLEQGPPIHYLSAERDLVTALGRPPPLARGMLAMGGASFGDPGGGTRSIAAPRLPAGVPFTSIASGECLRLPSIVFQPLDGTTQEVQEIAALWRGSAGVGAMDARILIGAQASETAFKQSANSHRVLHVATHGFFLDGDCTTSAEGRRGVGGLSAVGRIRTTGNPLLLSGLALAGANRRASAGPDEDDGILTAEEVAALDLSGVEWAVLSACDTGVGEIRAGEGVFGLRRAFQVAGARTVVMSLWSVDDQATRAWMRALYEGRFQRSLSTADAVHQASLTVLRDRRAKGLSTHPFYWAAFVAAGDWR